MANAHHKFLFACSIVAMSLAVIAGDAWAQTGPLPAAIQQQLAAPNANVAQIALAYAESNPAQASAVLQAAIDVLGANTNAADAVLQAFANAAAQLVAAGPDQNAALAGALAVAVQGVLADPQDGAVANGALSAAVAQEVAQVLQNPLVLQAAAAPAGALGGGPGGGAFGSFGNGGNGGAAGGGSNACVPTSSPVRTCT